MADFVQLIDVLDKYHENTLVEAIYRGIWQTDALGKNKSYYAVNSEPFSDWGSSGGGRKQFFYDDVQTLQILDFIYQWRNPDFDDVFMFESDKREILGADRFENFGWFGGVVGSLSANGQSGQSASFDVKTLDQIEQSLNPRLITLDSLLGHPASIAPALLIREIIWNGCYTYTRFPNFVGFGPSSKENAQALAAIGMWVKYSDNDEYWEWLEQDNPLFAFGWPVDKLPKFKWGDDYPDQSLLDDVKILSSIYKDGLHTVAKLLWLGQAKPVQINKALLTHGVWKITALGGSTYLEPSTFVEDNKIQTELHIEDLQPALVDYAKPILDGQKPTPELLGLHDGALCKYGWPDKHLPDFTAIIENIHPEPTAKLKVSDVAVQEVFSKDSKENQPYTPGQDLELSQSKQKGWEKLVMALIAFIRGEVPTAPDTKPHLELDELQQCISKRFYNTTGLQETSVDTKFGLANRHREAAKLPPIKSSKRKDK